MAATYLEEQLLDLPATTPTWGPPSYPAEGHDVVPLQMPIQPSNEANSAHWDVAPCGVAPGDVMRQLPLDILDQG